MIWTWEGGSAWCLSEHLVWPNLIQDRPFSAAASVYISREAWEFSSISLLGTLRPGDRRLCTRFALHEHLALDYFTHEKNEGMLDRHFKMFP